MRLLQRGKQRLSCHKLVSDVVLYMFKSVIEAIIIEYHQEYIIERGEYHTSIPSLHKVQQGSIECEHV